jgi:hypothetical protein
VSPSSTIYKELKGRKHENSSIKADDVHRGIGVFVFHILQFDFSGGVETTVHFIAIYKITQRTFSNI